ncbi:MAG: peptidoglycan DD-metalloendopeptidase family protein [Chitinivibrionales bacterium]|nr:peptidoglycan DD-metalloendopeptidase family protein [Chitinivibrionales bacterium]
MGKKRRTIILVPPGGTRIRSIRIRVSLVIAFAVLITIGFAGYFIPFSSNAIDVVRSNQRRNMNNQNVKMLQKIRTIYASHNSLDSLLQELGEQKGEIDFLAQFNIPEEKTRATDKKKSKKYALSDQLALIDKFDFRFSRAVDFLREHPAYLTKIPLRLPVEGQPFISTRFGITRDPFTGKSKHHYGLDFVAEKGTAVVAAADGVVAAVEKRKDWGLRVKIKHQYGFQTVYAHLASVKTGKGRKVSRGDVVGTIGSSGLSTGTHLHYEMWLDGTQVDPEKYLFPFQVEEYQVARARLPDNEFQ